MSCEGVCEIGIRDDLMMGPAKKMLVVMLIGIYVDWRMVVYVNF